MIVCEDTIIRWPIQLKETCLVGLTSIIVGSRGGGEAGTFGCHPNDRGFDLMARPNSRIVNLNRFPGRPRINMFSRKSNPVKVKTAVLTTSLAERRLANLKKKKRVLPPRDHYVD